MKICKTITTKIVSLIFVLLAMAACNDPYSGQSYTTIKTEDLPIASYLSTKAESFSLWTALLKYTDLYNTLNLQDNYTCFVPNDSAMNVYLKANGYNTVTDINLNTAKNLVKYHIIKGKVYTQSDFDDGIIPDTTATGDFLTMSISDAAVFYVNEEAAIVSHASPSNGQVHVINKVLTPITRTIAQELDNNTFSIFAAAIKETGYYDPLNTLHKYYTAFTVPDSVYNTAGIKSISDLKSWLTVQDAADGDSALYKYIGYHLMSEQNSYNELTTFSGSSTSKNLSTMATNELITVSEISNILYFNYKSDKSNNVTILRKNLSCKNGMMHVINGIMPIEAPKATTTTWEFTAYSELATLFSSVYRLKTLTASSLNYITSGQVSCYEWESVPSYYADNAVAYYVPIKSNSLMQKATNYDYLYLDLGQFGWIKMATSTIVKGTYTMTINHYNPHSSSGIAQLTFIIDGIERGTVQTMGSSTTTDQYLTKSLGTITFTETKPHVIKIMAADNNPSYLDGITFTPVN